MNEIVTGQLVSVTDGETIARLSRPRIFALEDPEDYTKLRAAHARELAPQTPYEQSLAEMLVGYEWEMARMRRFRDSAMIVKYRKLALNTLKTGDPVSQSREDTVSEDQLNLVEDLLHSDLKKRLAAEERFFAETGWEPADLQALAYAQAPGVSMFEQRIADLERRRRVLRDDYARLRATRSANAIEDAEIVEDAVLEVQDGN